MALKRVTDTLTIPPAVKPEAMVAWTQLLDWAARYRSFTVRDRLLPDFLIIGSQKCGTTYLYDRLLEHSSIAPALTKEVHFFDNNHHKGLDWYRGYFPSRTALRTATVTGEASPYYLYHPHVPRRVFQAVPDARLIVLLRNPVNRAYSHYYHEVRMGYESLSFEDALAAEPQRIGGEEQRMLADEDYYSFNHQHYAYLPKGIYVDQLKRWFEFFPREQILILKSEEFYQQTPTVLQQVTEFLGLPAWEPQASQKHKSSPYPKLAPALREWLAAYYEPHNQRLYEYLGIDFGWK